MSKLGKAYNYLFRHLQQTGLDTAYLYIKGKKWHRSISIIQRFLGEDVSKRQIRKYQRRLCYAYIRYGWNLDEYFMFHFSRLSHKGRREFITEVQKEYFCKTVNPKVMHKIFTNKGETYKYYSKYYRRDVCAVEDWERDKSAFAQFVEKHNSYLIKPLDGSMGTGIQLIQGKSLDEMKALLQAEYKSGFIAEELIRQNEKMAVLHPSSVNTIRITTFRIDDKIHIIQPFVRMGRGEDIVDNAAQGGIFATIDIATGIITTTSDEFGNKYVVHPETGVPILGFVIPEWQNALALAKELSGVLPECRFIGWDFAYTDDGWVMVEGNSKAQFICFQIAPQKGYKKTLESMLGCTLKEYCKHSTYSK
jgi:hypothetical protein